MRVFMMDYTSAKLLSFIICLITLGVSAAEMTPEKTANPQKDSQSAYSKLSGPLCKKVKVDREGGSSEQLCPAIKGYKLLVLDSDNRMSVTVITPDGARHPLEFWSTVTPQFSVLGNTAEWRIKQGAAQALILPLKINDNPNSAAATRYLIVVRLQGGDVCAIGKIHGVTASADARRLSNSAASASCLKQ